MEIKFLKNRKKFRKGGSNIKPDFYWMCILCMTFVLILFSLAFGIYLFIKTNEELVPPIINVNVDEQEMIKKERLDRVLQYFSERENKSVEILNYPSPVVDPSF